MAEVETQPTDGSPEEGPVPEVGLADEPVHEAGGHLEHEPRPSTYVGVGLILAVLTAVEVGLYYVELDTGVPDSVITLGLIVLMALKFFLVAMWYMHLKFESPLFQWLFYGGIALATAVFAVVLAASHVFPFFV